MATDGESRGGVERRGPGGEPCRSRNTLYAVGFVRWPTARRVVEQFMRTMLRLGLTGPWVAQLLHGRGCRRRDQQGHHSAAFSPTRRGGGGKLRLLWWQAPTLLNAHLSNGLKDSDAARVVYEPLAGFNRHGEFVPILAEAIPSLANGDLSPDGTAVTWRLKQGVVWHDGAPFTADDVIFTWEYAADSATSAVTIGSYQPIAAHRQAGRPHGEGRFQATHPLLVRCLLRQPRTHPPQAPVRPLRWPGCPQCPL